MSKEKTTLTKQEIIKLTKSGYFYALQDMLSCNFNDNLRRFIFYVAALGGKPTINRDVDEDELMEFGFDEIINDDFRLSVEPIETYSGSWGEVKNPEAINHLINKPMVNGLFCERIFGTNADFRYGHINVSVTFPNPLFPNFQLNQVLVVPTYLRPIVKSNTREMSIESMHEAYRRIVMRNNRKKKLTEVSAPQILIDNEQRMLKDAITDLIEGDPKYQSLFASAFEWFYVTLFNNQVDCSDYAQKLSGAPIPLDEARITEFEAFLNFLDGLNNPTSREKKKYVLQAIEYINTHDDFANSLIFCLLTGRRATDAERKARMQELAKMPKRNKCKTQRLDPIVEPAEPEGVYLATSSITYKEPIDDDDDDFDIDDLEFEALFGDDDDDDDDDDK